MHDEAFNVCRTSENYRIREVAEIVESVVPDSRIVLADSAGPDKRNYRVSGDKLAERLPSFQPDWTVRRGAEELYQAFVDEKLTFDDLEGTTFLRIRRVQQLQDEGRLGADLRWTSSTEGLIDV